jgi:hypothetical protein
MSQSVRAGEPGTELDFPPQQANVCRPQEFVNRFGFRILVPRVGVALLCAVAVCPAQGAGPSRVAAEEVSRALIVQDVQGKPHQPLADAGQKATVLFFVLHDCPLANSCAPEINRIVADYRARGVRSFLVYAEDDLSPKAARQHAKAHAYICPVLLDRGLQLVRFTGVAKSPEVAVLAPDNTELYRGRIDDRLVAFGKQRVTPTRRDLREALDAILAGKPVLNPVTQAIGCYLPTPADAKPEKSPGEKAKH